MSNMNSIQSEPRFYFHRQMMIQVESQLLGAKVPLAKSFIDLFPLSHMDKPFDKSYT